MSPRFRLLATIVLAFATLGASCSSNHAAAPMMAVQAFTLTPSSAEVEPGGTQTFLASGTGVSGPSSVTWSVQESGGGAITSAGVYTAPQTVGTYHVVATLSADKTKSATAPVTVENVLGVTVTPRVPIIAPGGTVAFTATIQGIASAQSKGVTWSVEESGGGTVDGSGHYTAPSGAGTFHVVATSAADTSKTARAAVVAGLLDPAHATVWQPGVVGGIPVRTTVCATINASDFGNGGTDSTAAVQKAIDACPANQVVLLSAGTFLWTNLVRLNKGISLRGAGNGQTIINGSGNTRYMAVGPVEPPQNQIYMTMMAHALLTADAKKGTNTLTVSNASSYAPGDLALISQKDDSTMMPPPSAGGDFLLWVDPDGSRHSNGQMVTVTSVAGNTLTIDGVLHSDYTVANAGVVARAPGVTRMAGVEGIRFVQPESAVLVTFCDQCWITGSETDTSGGDIEWWLSRRGEMRENYIHNSKQYSPGGAAYGVTIDSYTSDTLVENNVIYFFNKPFLFRTSGGGNVVAYNYIDGAQDGASPSWMEPDIDSHMTYSHMELVEGNLCGAIGLINTWGGAGMFTYFRNRVLAQHQDPALVNTQWGDQAAFTFNSGMGAYSNIVGNVLGQAGLKSTAGALVGKPAYYENVSEKDANNPPITAAGYTGTQVIVMYRLGNGSEPGAYSSFDVNETPFPNVPKVAPTVLRHGNYDYVTESVKTDPSVKIQTLPPSLYLVDKPAYFNDSPWPWVEPTGTTTKAYTLPAKTTFDTLKK